METFTDPHIGLLLRKYVDDNHISQVAWAHAQQTSPKVVHQYFKKPGMQTITLFNICRALKYNFFADLAAMLPPEFGSAVTASQEKIAALEKENEMLRGQVELLKEVVREK